MRKYAISIILLALLALSCGKKTNHVAQTLQGVEAAKQLAMETIEAAYLYRARDLKTRMDAGELTREQAEARLATLDAQLDQAANVLQKVQEAEKAVAVAAELYRANPGDPNNAARLNELISQVLALSQELYTAIDSMRGE